MPARLQSIASFGGVGLAEANRLLSRVGGRMLEIRLELQATSATKYGIKIGVSKDESEQTVVRFDTDAGELALDRSRPSLARNYGVSGGPLSLDGENLKLHIFIDHSMFEVYANGRKSITSRMYPQREDATGVKLWADGNPVVQRMEVWRLDPRKAFQAYVGRNVLSRQIVMPWSYV